MAEVPSRRQIGWQRRWSQRLWVRGFLPVVLLLVLWVFFMGSWIGWCGVPPVEPRAVLGAGCVHVDWETATTWHVIGTPTWWLGTNFTINGTRAVWHARQPLWDISQALTTDFKLIVKAGQVQLPLFYPAILAAVLAAGLDYRRRARHQPWRCTHCLYDLRNSAKAARCPECGNPFTMTEAHTPKP